MKYVTLESAQSKEYNFERVLESIRDGSFKKYPEIYHNQQSEIRRLPNGNIIKATNCKGFLAFYRFCQQNNNKHLPVFFNFKELGKGKYKYIMEMEALIKLSENEKSIIRKLDDVFWNMTEKVPVKNPSFPGVVYTIYKILDKLYKTYSKDKTLVSDIHNGNFMKRKDGTIVILDPMWDMSNRQKKEVRHKGRVPLRDNDRTPSL